MSTANLLNKLIERGIVAVGTEIEAVVRRRDFNGHSFVANRVPFTIIAIQATGSGTFTLGCADTIDGARRIISLDDVATVDGMAVARFAETFNIRADGGVIVIEGKRRGRRPFLPQAPQEPRNVIKSPLKKCPRRRVA